MRLIATFHLEHEIITNNYRGFLLSFLKFSLSKEYYQFFNKTYITGPSLKPFSFSVYIKNIKLEEGLIISPHKQLMMILSSNDYELMLLLYNSMLLNKNKKIAIKPENKAVLKRISLKYLDQIETREIKIKMLAPVLVRLHNNKTNKDIYLSVEDAMFQTELNANIQRMLKELNCSDDTLEIIPLDAKKIVVPLMKTKLDATLGTFLMKGEKVTLDLLYKIGIGSRRNYGFGLFEVINE